MAIKTDRGHPAHLNHRNKRCALEFHSLRLGVVDPSKEPRSYLTSQREKRSREYPVPVIYHLKGDRWGLVSLAFQFILPIPMSGSGPLNIH
jgi:hypothetical protein